MVRRWWFVWLVVAMPAAWWAFVVPVGGTWDEPAHLVKAAAVWQGQLLGEHRSAVSDTMNDATESAPTLRPERNSAPIAAAAHQAANAAPISNPFGLIAPPSASVVGVAATTTATNADRSDTARRKNDHPQTMSVANHADEMRRMANTHGAPAIQRVGQPTAA